MIKKTVEISAHPAHVTVRNRQLTLERDGETVGSLPCEDLGMVLVDHSGTTYTHAALTALLESDAALVICGRNHLPQGLLLPFSDHTQVVSRLYDQIDASKPLKKRLWQQIVNAKILAQADNLNDSTAKTALLELLTEEVETGGKSGPLMVQLHSMTASLARCLGGEQQQLEIPRPCNSADTVSCG